MCMQAVGVHHTVCGIKECLPSCFIRIHSLWLIPMLNSVKFSGLLNTQQQLRGWQKQEPRSVSSGMMTSSPVQNKLVLRLISYRRGRPVCRLNVRSILRH